MTPTMAQVVAGLTLGARDRRYVAIMERDTKEWIAVAEVEGARLNPQYVVWSVFQNPDTKLWYTAAGDYGMIDLQDAMFTAFKRASR